MNVTEVSPGLYHHVWLILIVAGAPVTVADLALQTGAGRKAVHNVLLELQHRGRARCNERYYAPKSGGPEDVAWSAVDRTARGR